MQENEINRNIFILIIVLFKIKLNGHRTVLPTYIGNLLHSAERYFIYSFIYVFLNINIKFDLIII